MGIVEELPEDCGTCPACGKIAETKCTGCKQIYYCNRDCQKKHWKQHKPECKALPYRIGNSPDLGNFMVASRDLKKGEILFNEPPLCIGPNAVTLPICLHCYTPVDGSFKCPKSGWPLCGPSCASKVAHNAEVVVPTQCDAKFEIDSYTEPCYLYECINVMRALLLQKTSPAKYKKLMAMESHFESRRDTPAWKRTHEMVVEVMKKTLGIMVFEAIMPEFDWSDETIQKIQGIFDTNAKEIRLPYSEAEALYATASVLEHNCTPNTSFTFSDDFSITVRAGRNIKAGEHLSIMYTHALWGTVARRDHLWSNKKFWCRCDRCAHPTEFGTNFSTILDDGHPVLPEDPLDSASQWLCEKTGLRREAAEVKGALTVIGEELAMLQEKGSIADYENFIENHKGLLHPNHYHMATAKNSLLQMYGRVEDCLIQDMPVELLDRKSDLCRESLEVLYKLDPAMIRLQIYAATANYELHLSELQKSKRNWETGKVSTEEFRELLKEPHKYVLAAIELLKEETNSNLPEGLYLIQAKDTLSQLESFMKTVGCQM